MEQTLDLGIQTGVLVSADVVVDNLPEGGGGDSGGGSVAVGISVRASLIGKSVKLVRQIGHQRTLALARGASEQHRAEGWGDLVADEGGAYRRDDIGPGRGR